MQSIDGEVMLLLTFIIKDKKHMSLVNIYSNIICKALKRSITIIITITESRITDETIHFQ